MLPKDTLGSANVCVSQSAGHELQVVFLESEEALVKLRLF